jgi:hypothetical protein
VHVFNLRERGGHYHFFGFPPQRPQMPAHDQRDAYLTECAAHFARDLELILKRDPLQWYNFYPFWNNRAVSSEARMDSNTHDVRNRTNVSLSPSDVQREKRAASAVAMDVREEAALATSPTVRPSP